MVETIGILIVRLIERSKALKIGCQQYPPRSPRTPTQKQTARFLREANRFELAKCVDLIEKTNLPFMLGFNRRYDPNFSALRNRVVLEKELQNVHMLHITSREHPLPNFSVLENQWRNVPRHGKMDI